MIWPLRRSVLAGNTLVWIGCLNLSLGVHPDRERTMIFDTDVKANAVSPLDDTPDKLVKLDGEWRIANKFFTDY